jgi:hypothetical protein
MPVTADAGVKMAEATATRSHSAVYAAEPRLRVAAFRQLLVDSGLGALRPLDDEPRLAAMLAAADLLLAAPAEDGRLLGLAPRRLAARITT